VTEQPASTRHVAAVVCTSPVCRPYPHPRVWGDPGPVDKGPINFGERRVRFAVPRRGYPTPYPAQHGDIEWLIVKAWR
jgi:hypothetical protein